MSELKVHKIGDLCFDFKMGKDVGIDFYLKSEADKVIEDLEMKLAAAKLVLRLNEPKALYSNLETMSRLSHKIDVVARQERHQKYKRCLAMSKWCESEAYIHEHGSDYDEDLVVWFGKWHNRWLKIAGQYKEIAELEKENGLPPLYYEVKEKTNG